MPDRKWLEREQNDLMTCRYSISHISMVVFKGIRAVGVFDIHRLLLVSTPTCSPGCLLNIKYLSNYLEKGRQMMCTYPPQSLCNFTAEVVCAAVGMKNELLAKRVK